MQRIRADHQRVIHRDVAVGCPQCPPRHPQSGYGFPNLICRNCNNLSPSLCILQVVASIFITGFILGLPLGDPNIQCGENAQACDGSEFSKCFLCYVYNFLLSMAIKVTELLDTLLTFVLNFISYVLEMFYAKVMAILNQVKLKMYEILQGVDGDFCGTCNVACLKKQSWPEGEAQSHETVYKADKSC